MDVSFFPNNIAVAQVEDWMWETPVLSDEENLLLSSVANKRLREFRAGRHCARLALKHLGVENFPLLRDERGAPLWPEFIAGSITHAGERCVAIAAHKNDYLSVAVDIEKDRLIKDETLERIAHPSEIEQLYNAPADFSKVNLRAVLFGIKECVHKIYYPLNKHTLDFLDVTVRLNWQNQSFFVNIINPAKDQLLAIDELFGAFGHETGYVYSRICYR